MKEPICKCPANSPFRWHEHVSENVLKKEAEAAARRAAASAAVERLRSQGHEPGLLRGLSNKSEARILQQRQVIAYTKA